MRPPPEPARSRAALLAWAAAIVALSAATDLRILAAAALAAAIALRRGAARNAARVARAVLPVAGGLALASMAWLRVAAGAWPPPAPFAALVLRASTLAFLTFGALERTNLFHALAPSPTATRLLALTLAHIHALRRVATDSADGLRSRLPRRPRALDVVRGAGGVTAALFALSAQNAREAADALRSRGV